jgi:hypothetical protein
MFEKVKEAIEKMEAAGIKVSVRAVREAIGGGSHSDVGEAVRAVYAERELLKTVRDELPQALQDKASIISMDFWIAAQELANRAVEDVRRGCEVRVGNAEGQANESLREIDNAEAQIRELFEQLKEKDAAYNALTDLKRAVTERAEGAEARVGALEAEVRVRDDHAKRRDRELELAYGSINQMAAAVGAPRKAGALDSGKSTKGETTLEAAKPASPSGTTGKPASPSDTTAKPVNPEKLVDFIIAIMKQAEGKALSTAEIFAKLPESENVQQRQVYNLLYRRAAAGATFESVGDGKFALRG